MMNLIALFGPAAGTVIGWLARHFLERSRWTQVKAIAKAAIADPGDATEDPVIAVTNAFIKTNLDRIAKTAQEVKTTLNGIHE